MFLEMTYQFVDSFIHFPLGSQFVDWSIGNDEVRLTSQNCGLYGPVVHPQLIHDVDHGLMVSTGAYS
jgi:hypothetical protein